MTCMKIPTPDDPINDLCSECGHITGYHIPNGCELCRIPETVNQYLAAHAVDTLQQELLKRARVT